MYTVGTCQAAEQSKITSATETGNDLNLSGLWEDQKTVQCLNVFQVAGTHGYHLTVDMQTSQVMLPCKGSPPV